MPEPEPALIVSVLEPPTVTGEVAALVKDRLLIVKLAPSTVLRLLATGLVVSKNTFVIAPGGAWVSMLLVASVRQLVESPAPMVFQALPALPDQ